MAIQTPQADLPAGLRGGADTWDQPQASALLDADWFEQAASPVIGSLNTAETGSDSFAASGTVDPFPAMLVDDVEKFDFVGGPNPTISGISFGTPASDRIVVVFFQCAATPSAVAIGGVSATFVANLSGSDYYGIAWAAVPSSSSGSLVLTGGGGYGLFSGAFAVYGEGLPALDFAFVSGATSSDIDLAGGGVVVGAAITTGAISWTGVTEQAEYVGLTGSNTSLALNYDTTYGAPATIQTSPAAITRLLSFGTVLAEIVGTLSATESGDDTAAASGEVLVQGDTAATETGDDTPAMAGVVLVKGTAAAAETGADAASAAGKVIVQGAATASEAGADTATASGDVAVAGSLSAAEVGQDTAALSGNVPVQGDLAVTESGQDVFAGLSAGSSSGDMAAVESGADGFAADGSASSGAVSRAGFEMGGRRVYIKRDRKIHIFDTVEDADAWEAAEAAAQEAIAKAKTRTAKRRIVRKVDTAIEHEVLRLDLLDALVARFNLKLDLPSIEARQDWAEYVRIAMLARELEDEEEIESLLLLM